MLKKHMTPLTKGGQLHSHKGKGASEQSLSRGQMSSLTSGDSFQRSMQNYGKASPMPQGSMGPNASMAIPNSDDDGMD